jgi:hypothetical protein
MTPATAGTFPPLLVPPVSNVSTMGAATRTIMETGGTSQGGAIIVPPAVLSRPAPGAPVPIAVFPTNPAVFQVATSINYAWPAATATLAPGGAPGTPSSTAVLGTGIVGGIIAYSGSTKAFGGPAQFAISAGPGAAGGRVPPNTMGALPVASVWINAFGKLPGSATMVGVVGASAPLGLGQPGAPVSAPTATTMFGPVAKGLGLVNQMTPTNAVNCCTVGPAGTIPSSISVTFAFPSNMVTGSKGFPWATGFLTISQPAASPAEVFYASATDMRVAGVGNISLVSGALSARALSGPNANRGWLSLTLPEPTAALGSLGALAMLGLCHGLVRRRSH